MCRVSIALSMARDCAAATVSGAEAGPRKTTAAAAVACINVDDASAVQRRRGGHESVASKLTTCGMGRSFSDEFVQDVRLSQLTEWRSPCQYSWRFFSSRR